MSDEHSGRRVTVMGLGRFGGGVGVTRWLADGGARVLVTDLAAADDLAGPLADLTDLVDQGVVDLRLGGHCEEDFTDTDLVVANPAVPRPWKNPYLLRAAAAGVPVTTEIRLVLERIDRRRVIGVTGTAGKSTTAAMIHHLFARTDRPAHLGGNIGGSLLPRLGVIGRDDWVVLELSSAMLHWLGAGAGAPGAPGLSPHVAVLTNLAPNHLDWHGSFAHYQQCKRHIFDFQEAGDHRIDGPGSETAEPTIPLRVPGAHNRRNAAMAMAAAGRAIDLPPHEAGRLLADFPGLPHRLQLVGERDGLRFVNDSKSTTPEATLLAVQALGGASLVHLIAGGHDKGLDLAPIGALAPRLAGMYTIGATGPALADRAGDGRAVFRCGSLESATRRALARMRRGEVLLLSPGCASWDQFANYQERGEAFCALIHDAADAPAPEA